MFRNKSLPQNYGHPAAEAAKRRVGPQVWHVTISLLCPLNPSEIPGVSELSEAQGCLNLRVPGSLSIGYCLPTGCPPANVSCGHQDSKCTSVDSLQKSHLECLGDENKEVTLPPQLHTGPASVVCMAVIPAGRQSGARESQVGGLTGSQSETLTQKTRINHKEEWLARSSKKRIPILTTLPGDGKTALQ